MTLDEVDIIQFNDDLGNIIAVRDKKDFDSYRLGDVIDIPEGSDIDEVIGRDDVFGIAGQNLLYAVVEFNGQSFVENDFDTNKLKKLNIPIIEAE